MTDYSTPAETMESDNSKGQPDKVKQKQLLTIVDSALANRLSRVALDHGEPTRQATLEAAIVHFCNEVEKKDEDAVALLRKAAGKRAQPSKTPLPAINN